MSRQGGVPHIRAQLILEHLGAVGTSSPAELAERFGVSAMTMHRDLTMLAEQGLISKKWGSVSINRTRALESSAKVRSATETPEKRGIARVAAQLIGPGATALLDDSTTASFVVDFLPPVSGVSIATNFLPVINSLAQRTDVSLHVIGGRLDRAHESFVGAGAIDTVRGLRVETAFISTTTLSAGGLFHQEDEVVLLKRAMIEIAERVVVLADATKFGTPSLHQICDWGPIDRLITSPGVSAGLLENIARQGVVVEVADSVAEQVNDKGASENGIIAIN